MPPLSSGRFRRALVATLGSLALLLTAAPSAAPAVTGTTGTTASSGAAAVPSSWTFSGRGFGHGVGMSQYGAYAQAKAGWTAREILAFYYQGTTYDAVVDTQTIRVNVVRGASTASIAGLATGTSGGRLTITAGGRTMTSAAGQTVSLRRSSGSVVATCSACSPTSVTGTSVSVTWDESRTDLSVGGRRYRHAPFVVTPTSGAATLEGVLHLQLSSEYLDQIREVPWSWPDAVLQAQAAAARSYALRKVAAGVRSSCACHVTDGQGDQVYGSVPTGAEAAAWPRWRAAVAVGGDPSTGFVPRYGGQVIEALYSSSSGGRTVANEDVWLGGAPVPYLRSVADPWSLTADNPRRSWTTTVTGSRVAAAFGLPDVVSLRLSDRSSAETVRQATATSSSGATSTRSGNAMRSALGLSSASIHRPISRVAGSAPADLVAASAQSAPSTAGTVVIASSYEADVPHLLMARPLAGSLRAPLLLSGRSSLTSSAVRELDRRGGTITRAYLVAGSPMVGSSVVSQLERRGITVTRVGLSDRDATAAAVVDLMEATVGVSTAAASTRDTAPEAGAFSAVAGVRREPIVWAGATKVGWRARAALQRAGVRTVRLLGPTSRISADVATDLTGRGFRVTRFSGSSASLVSAQIAEYFRNSYRGDTVVLARSTSTRTSDPVAAAGYGLPVLVLTGTSAPGSVTSLVQRSPQWPQVRAMGSTSRVTSAALVKVRDA